MAAAYSGGETDKLIEAIRGKNEEEVEKILKAGGVDVNNPDSDGVLPLFVAVETGDIKFVQKLLEHYVNLDAVNDEDETALHVAVAGYSPEMLNYLLATILHNKIDQKDKEGKTPLYSAILSNNLEFVKILVDNGAVVNKKVLRQLMDLASSPGLTKKEAESLKKIGIYLFDVFEAQRKPKTFASVEPSVNRSASMKLVRPNVLHLMLSGKIPNTEAARKNLNKTRTNLVKTLRNVTRANNRKRTRKNRNSN